MTELAHNIPAYNAEENPQDMMSWPDKYNPVTSKNEVLPEKQMLTKWLPSISVSGRKMADVSGWKRSIGWSNP